MTIGCGVPACLYTGYPRLPRGLRCPSNLLPVASVAFQERYSWHRTVLYHHSNKEWSDADRRASKRSWTYQFIVAIFILIVDLARM